MKKSKVSIIIKYVILAIAIAINVFILVNAFIEGQKSSEISGHATEVAANIINEAIPNTITEVSMPSFRQFFRKFAGHFCLFGLSGIFSSISFYLFLKDIHGIPHWTIHIMSGVFGFVVAIISELAQIVTDGRTGSMRDVAIDSTGYLLGLLVVVLVVLIVEFNIKNLQKKQVE